MPWEATKLQRHLTLHFIAKHGLDAPTIWLNPHSAGSSADDAVKPPEGLDTDLEAWREEDNERNLGVRLVAGLIELKIKSPDDAWTRCFFEACAALRLDARAAYGSRQVSSILFRIDQPDTIDRWSDRWPRGHKDKAGAWVQTEFAYSLMPTPRAPRPIWRNSSPLPGSKFAGELIVWRPMGKQAATDIDDGIEALEPRPIAATNMETICRVIAFATLAYWVRAYLDGLTEWDESLTRTIGGWTARLVREGQAINARGQSLEGVCWAPVDDASTAGQLLNFMGALGANKSLGVAFLHADGALERNPAAPVPGWGSIETLFGVQAKVGIRRAFRAGLDIDGVEQLAERYLYDTEEHEYLDREAVLKDKKFNHKFDNLVHQYENEPVYVGNKRLNVFKIFSASSLRVDVSGQEFRPGHEPASLLRSSRVHGLVGGEDRHHDESLILNTFPGFAIKPIAAIDPAVMNRAVTMLDRMLALLTRDRDDQILWLKKFIAFIARHPEIKPQVCPILVGGQGIGKSLFGEYLMRALFGTMAGSAEAAALSDNKFLITPFIGKLVTFIDEVKLESVGAINTIKKLVRADYVSGQVKFGHQHDFYIPSRLLIASNSPDIGLTPSDAADRTFFFIVSWTAENKQMSEHEFLDWSRGLKPFYNDLVEALDKVTVRQHLMRYFVDLEVERAELEDLTFSSRNDETVVRSTMSKAREVARAIVADARVMQGNDITAWFNTASLRDAIRRHEGNRTKVEASQVMIEFERAGVVQTMRGDLRRFKYGYGKLIKKMSEAHGLEILPNWDYRPGDFDDNEIMSPVGAPPWRGNKQQQQSGGERRDFDPDAMDPY